MAALAVAVVILAGTAVAIWNVRRVSSAGSRVVRADDLRTALSDLQRGLLDAEAPDSAAS